MIVWNVSLYRVYDRLIQKLESPRLFKMHSGYPNILVASCSNRDEHPQVEEDPRQLESLEIPSIRLDVGKPMKTHHV